MEDLRTVLLLITFVLFISAEQGQTCMEPWLGSKNVRCTLAAELENDTAFRKTRFNEVYVKDLAEFTAYVDLKKISDEAVPALNGKTFEDKEWYLGIAQNQSVSEQAAEEDVDKNLYDTVENEKVKMFLEYVIHMDPETRQICYILVGVAVMLPVIWALFYLLCGLPQAPKKKKKKISNKPKPPKLKRPSKKSLFSR